MPTHNAAIPKKRTVRPFVRLLRAGSLFDFGLKTPVGTIKYILGKRIGSGHTAECRTGRGSRSRSRINERPGRHAVENGGHLPGAGCCEGSGAAGHAHGQNGCTRTQSTSGHNASGGAKGRLGEVLIRLFCVLAARIGSRGALPVLPMTGSAVPRHLPDSARYVDEVSGSAARGTLPGVPICGHACGSQSA